MDLKCVTCSGANEYTNIDTLFVLYEHFPCIEFGIQVSGQKCGLNSRRFGWLKDIYLQIFKRKKNLPLALHLNQDWVSGFCSGVVAPELKELLSYVNLEGDPLFQRIQLNFKIGREKEPQLETLENMMLKFSSVRFILSYNNANAALIEKLYQRHNVVFDCLYDESFGEGVAPKKRKAPVFPDIVQGYAGGLSPENVVRELNKIAAVLPPKAQFFIDAEGKLKGDDGHFSYSKAHDFMTKVTTWYKKKI